MSDPPQTVALSSRIGTSLRMAVVGAALALGLLPLLFDFIGMRFLPSPFWISRTTAFAIASSLIWAAGSWVLVRDITGVDTPNDPVKRQMAGFGAFLASAFLGYNFVSESIPLIGALIAGQPTEIAFTVDRVGEGNRRHCRNPIGIAAGGDLCGFPEDFVSAFKRGDTVIASGRGTRQGVFLTMARKAPPQ